MFIVADLVSLKSSSPILAEWNFQLLSVRPVHFRLKGCLVLFLIFDSNFNRAFS